MNRACDEEEVGCDFGFLSHEMSVMDLWRKEIRERRDMIWARVKGILAGLVTLCLEIQPFFPNQMHDLPDLTPKY